MAEIAVEVIVTAEQQYREHRVHRYEWRLQRKCELLAERQKRQEEAQRKERERQAALAQARIDKLLAQATSFKKANAIRAYVNAVCAAMGSNLESEMLECWRKWALEQADRLDPIASRTLHGGL